MRKCAAFLMASRLESSSLRAAMALCHASSKVRRLDFAEVQTQPCTACEYLRQVIERQARLVGPALRLGSAWLGVRRIAPATIEPGAPGLSPRRAAH